MQYLDDYRNNGRIKDLLYAIRRKTTRKWSIMEICGGQTHTIARYRIDEMLPPSIGLVHGPGCPVCVTPTAIIDHALEMAARPDVIFASFGDMMRVPGSCSDLLQAKAKGADVRMMYSPLDAVELAASNPEKEIVFFAVGFETTAPVHLMALQEARRRKLKNFSLLCSLFAVPPAMEAILSQPDNLVDGFLAAGHVCTVTGNAPYHRLLAQYQRPIIITGFEPVDLLYGIYLCINQLEQGYARVQNAYRRAVSEEGNLPARQLMDEYLESATREWRGIGTISASGFLLKDKFSIFNAALKFPFSGKTETKKNGEKSCIAGEIMKGKKQVADCSYFGSDCVPDHPLGAPMVSDEGVCAAYYKYN
ncbi:MAG: hydrogenase formation protein HypD [Bacteroidales bacterium]|jgi:hydrogenase expression/formation protein HypD|nr:hydrogenase formation protein HypD [Bacteroidales bacterium]